MLLKKLSNKLRILALLDKSKKVWINVVTGRG